MANSIEENLLFLQQQQGKSLEVLNTYMQKNNIAARGPAVNTPVAASNQLPFETGSDIQKRMDIVSPDTEGRSAGSYLNQAGVTAANAYTNLSRSLAATSAAAVTPLLNTANSIMGKPTNSMAENVESFDTWMKYGDTKAKIKAWESPELQKIRATGAAIDNDPNLTEPQRYIAKMKFWGSNPVTALMDGGGELFKSGAEMALFGGIGKAVGIASAAGRVGLSSAIPGAASHVLGVIDDPNMEVTDRTGPTAFLSGAMTGLTGAAFTKLPFDVDSWITGGTGQKVVGSRAKAITMGALGEGGQETIQGPLAEILTNLEARRPITTNLGSNFADSQVLGMASGTIGGGIRPVNNTPVSTETLEQRADRLAQERDGTLDEQLDMTSEKAAPVRVFKQALYDLNSKEEGVSAFAQGIIQRTSTTLESHKVELEDRIRQETDPTVKEQLSTEYSTFMDTKYNPLKAEVKNYISTGSSPSAIKSYTDSMAANEANRAKLATQGTSQRANIDSLLTEIANSRTNNTSISSNVPETGKPYQSLIQSTSNKYGVNSALINAIIHTESGFNPNARSPVGASGLMQLMPDTAKGLGVINSQDPAQNLDGGIRYIKAGLDRYNGNLDHALMAYNWGQGNLAKYLKAKAEGKNPTIPAETRKYVVAVKTRMAKYAEGMGNTSSISTVPSNSRGDTRYTNKEAYAGLRIKGSEAYGGKGGAIGHTIDFAHVIQNTLGDTLERFTGFDDTYNRKTKNHSGGKGVDFSIKNGSDLAVSNKVEADLYAAAKAQGFQIKVLNEYDPKKVSKGSAPHMHITVVGRTGASINSSTPNGGNTNTSTNRGENPLSSFNELFANSKQTMEEFDSLTLEETTLEKEVKDTEKERLARVAAAKGNVDSKTAAILYSTKQAEALREVDELKAKMAAMNNLTATQDEIINGKKAKGNNPLESTLGLKDYDERFAAALATNDSKSINQDLAYLNRFAVNHESKRQLINQILTEDLKGGGVSIAPNASGEWIRLSDAELKDMEAVGKAIPLRITGENNLTRAINVEADLINESVIKWSNLTSSLMEDIDPVELKSKQITTDFSTPVSTTTVEPIPLVPIASVTPTPTATGSTITPPVVAAFTPANNAAEAGDTGFYLGRAKDEDGQTVSISSLDPKFKGGEENVGKPGWLGDGGTQTKTIDDYIGKFKGYATEYKSFVPTLMSDLAKPLYAYKNPKPQSETNFLLSLASEIKGKTPTEVAEYIDRIEGFSKAEGIKLGVAKKKIVTPTDTAEAPDRKVRSSIEAKGKSQGKASPAMKPSKAPNEKSNKSAEGKNEYTNQYTHNEKRANGDEEVWQVLINRDASTNKIADISVIQGDRDVEVFVAPNTSWSDEATIDWLQKEGFQLQGKYTQADYNAESVAVPETEMDYLEKIALPKEIKGKAIKATSLMDKFIGLVDSKNIPEKELVLYSSIINPLLNFNPSIEVNISSAIGGNRYDAATNTIHINPNNKGHVVAELARLTVLSSTENLAIKLEDNSYDKLDAKNADIVKLNDELTYIKQIISRNGLLGTDAKLDIEMRKRLLDALSSNSKLLSAATTDIEIMQYLQSISYNLGANKSKNSVFNKMVSTLRTFFNIGNKNETTNMYDKLLELTARTAQIQAMNKEVSFNSSEEGKAHIFQNVIEANAIAEMEKSYYSRDNLIAKFKQVTAKSKPLSGVANLASKLKLDLMQGVNALTKISPTNAQREQVEDFLQFRDEFAIHLMDTFEQKKITYKVEGETRAMSREQLAAYEDKNGKVPTDKLTVNDFSSQDLKSNLMDADGNIDENTLTAAAVAAYDLLIEYGNRTTNRDKDIRKLLNLDDDSTNYIPKDVQDAYKDGVMLKNVQGNALGNKVTTLMNITPNGLGSVEIGSELDTSVGEWVISAMQSADLIHLRSMPTIDHYKNIESVGGELTDTQLEVLEDTDNQKGIVSFISIVDKDSKNRNPRIQEIVDASKHTLGYMSNIFGSEVGLIAPTLLATDVMIDKIRGTVSSTSKDQLDMMHTMQQAPMRVNNKAYDALMTVMDKHRSATLLMMNADVTAEQLAAEHVSDRHSVKSSSEGLLRELDTMMDFVGSLKKDKQGKREAFFDSIYGAKNNRMHYAANMINFQLSKIHRAMVDYENFEADVDITGLETQNWYNADGTTSELGFILRGIMEQAEGTEDLMKAALEGTAFTKGFTVDKLPSEAILDHFYKYVTTDAQVISAVAAMDKLLNQSDKFTDADMEAITELVTFWDGDIGSFRVLMELTNLLNAHKNGENKVTTSIGVGSDGINNGIAISTIQMGVATDKFLAQVGIIPEGGEYAQLSGYHDTRKLKDLGDYYEGLSAILLPYLNEATGKAKALVDLNTSIKKRKFMKAVLIPFGYSAGDKRLQQVAFSQLLEDIKGTMKNIAAMDENSEEAVKDLAKLEAQLTEVIGEPVNLPKGKAILEYWFSGKHLAELMKNHQEELATAITDGIKVYAGNFIEERNRNVKIQNANSELYLEVSKDVIAKGKEKYKQSLRESDLYKGLSDAQLDTLIKNEGIPRAFYYENVEAILENIRPTIRTPFNVAIEDKASNFSVMKSTKTLGKNDGAKAANKRVADGNLHSTSTELAIIRMVEESVGITVSSAQVQGADAFIAAWASAKAASVNRNIHDQGDSGVRNFVSMSQAQNQATFEVLKIYHVQLESLDSFASTLDAISLLASEGTIDTATYESAIIRAVDKLIPMKERTEAIKEAKLGKDPSNKEIITKVYAPMLDAIASKVRTAEHSKLEILKRMRVVQQYAGENGEYLPTDADRASVDLEYPKIESKLNKILSTFEKLKEGTVTTEISVPVIETQEVSELVSLIDTQIKLGNDTNQSVSSFLVQLKNYLLPTMMSVNPNLTFSIRDDFKDSNNNGSYIPSENHININSNLLNSNPQQIVSVLLHEIVHAVTTNKMVLSLDPVVTEAFNELEQMFQELQGKATTYMRSSEGTMYNVFEMIAYGLTDGPTMQFIVNNLKGDYKIPKGAGKIRENLTTFMNSVTRFFMGSKKNTGDYAKGIKNFAKMQQLIDITIKKLTVEEVSKSTYINVPAIQYASAQTSPLETLKNMSNGNASTEHVAHLDRILDTLVADTISKDGDMVTDIIDNVSQQALSAGFSMSDKELYTMEIIKATVNEYLNTVSGSKTAKELRNIFMKTSQQLTRESFLNDSTNATQSEIAIAQRKLDYVRGQRIKPKEQTERYIALVATNPEMRAIVDNMSSEYKSGRQGTWFDKLMAVLDNIFRFMTGKVIGTNNLSNSGKIDQLLKRLQAINNNAANHTKNRFDIKYEESLKLLTVPLNTTTNYMIDMVFKGIRLSGTKFSTDSYIGSALRTITMARLTGLNAIGEEMIKNSAANGGNASTSNKLTTLGDFLTELVETKGIAATVEESIRMTNKVGQSRDSIKKATIRMLASTFSKELDSKESASITKSLLKSDMASLMLNGYQLAKVMKLMRNQNERKREVARLEAIILNNSNGNDILTQTKSLALYMAKEESVDYLVKNAENIAIGKDSWYETNMESMDKDLRDTIDSLASLYAFDYTDNASRKTFLELLVSEEEGIKAFLQTHKDMIKISKENFKDNPYSYIKGFTPQLTNNLKSLMFAETAEDVTKLESEGWIKVGDSQLKQDPTDTSDSRTMMFHNDMLYQDYVSGALDMKDTHAKGSSVYDLSTLRELKRVEQAKMNKRRSRNASMNYMDYDPRKVKGNSMIANYNSEGTIINYSYEMSGELRDTYLERNNNGFEMLGIMNSDAHFKPAIAESQRSVANILHADFEDSYAKDPRQYVVLDPNSKDESVQIMWRMMPYAFKAEATKLFGKGNPIVVRANIYNSVFGFRAYSISEVFDPKHSKESVQGIVATVLTAVIGPTAKTRVLQAERLYQQGIDKMKNFIVIRNTAVLIGNLVSNSLLLSLHGVPPVAQIRDMISVWRNGGDYRKIATRLAEIDVEISINQSRPKVLKELKRERNIISKEMEQNPMHEFMQAGLMSTIVEDVGINTEDTGFRSELEKKVDAVTDIIPQPIRTAFNWAVMSPGTPLHEFMKHAAQFSDLAAKYTLATHKINTGELDMKGAITEAQDNFINYDVPTGKGIDYMNRMGLFMFTKFFIRFQQVMIKRLGQNAGSTIGQHIAVEQLTGFSGILDPLAITRLGNMPLESGILGYGAAFNNISTVDLIPGI